MDTSNFLAESGAIKQEMIERRRDFHRHPELGFEERRTAEIVAEVMGEFTQHVKTGVAGTGVVALMEGKRSRPTALLRFDMDALPIQEETGAPYSSVHPGVMHACGHDGHTAVGLAVARLLHAHLEQLPGVVKFVFQPAEEGLGGAVRMVEEGVLLDPKPDFSLAFHIWNEKPVGWIAITSGPTMAGCEILTIEIAGRGGHGAAPHEAVDPILAAAHVISALQSVISRNLDPQKAGVVSITQVRAGETFNVIPSTACLNGTIRTCDSEVREMVLERVDVVASGVAKAMGCSAKITTMPLTPPVVNDERIAERLQFLARQMFPDAVICSDQFTMVSDDMAFMMDTIPGCYMFIGSSNAEKGLNAAHHHPKFDFDEAVLPQAAALMAAAVWTLLEEK
jgi:amidohydrolase